MGGSICKSRVREEDTDESLVKVVEEVAIEKELLSAAVADNSVGSKSTNGLEEDTTGMEETNEELSELVETHGEHRGLDLHEGNTVSSNKTCLEKIKFLVIESKQM